MKRIDIIGQNGNDGLHYNAESMKALGEPFDYSEKTSDWLFAGDGFDEWDFDGFVVFTTGGSGIFFDQAIAGSPTPRGLRFYLPLNLPEIPKWENED